MLVRKSDGADLAVRAIREDGADRQGFCSGFRFRGAMEFHDVCVDRLGMNGGGFLLSGRRKNHAVHPLGFGGKVGLDISLQAPAVGLLVGSLDGANVGVGTTNQNVIEESFLCAGAFERVVEAPDILL